jgi:hypothetical protein
MNKQVENEVKSAYADCWMKDEKEGYAQRNLSFRASDGVSIDEAIALCKKYIKGYNDFVPSCLKPLKKLDPDGLVYIAREGSVCVYFETGAEELTDREEEMFRLNMKADEFDNMGDGVYRIWWD